MFLSLESVNTISLSLCSFFFPFRLFQFLAHHDLFQPAKTVINAFVRTTPAMTVYGFLSLIMIISWAMGVHISLSPYYPEFDNFQDTLFSMITRDLQLIKSYHDLRNGTSYDSPVL